MGAQKGGVRLGPPCNTALGLGGLPITVPRGLTRTSWVTLFPNILLRRFTFHLPPLCLYSSEMLNAQDDGKQDNRRMDNWESNRLLTEIYFCVVEKEKELIQDPPLTLRHNGRLQRNINQHLILSFLLEAWGWGLHRTPLKIWWRRGLLPLNIHTYPDFAYISGNS